MKKNLSSVIVLTVICLVVSAALAAVNYVTAPIIEANNNAAANDALLVVMPDGGTFTELNMADYTLPATVTNVYEASNGGYVIRLVTSGYSSGLTIMCGVSADGTVTGAVCLASGETLGYEKTYGENFTGKDAAGVDAVDTVSGATRTTAGYKNAVKDAINAATILGGGSVDLRDPAQILQDNLNAALGTEDLTFETVFLTEALDSSVTHVYKSGADYVVELGETYVGVKDGSVVGEAANGDVALAAVNALTGSVLSDVDLSSVEGMPKAVQSVKVTSTGNYVFELRAAGYGITGKYFASGEYIYIRLCIAADGVILDCLTTAQGETENIGDVCADPSYYEQYIGKDHDTYKEVDTIAGASEYTDPAYRGAIRQAFEAFEILKGANNG